MTLLEAKEKWENLIHDKGGECPCCGRFGKIYSRSINETMAKSLIWLAHEHTLWVDVPNKAPRWLIRSNQLPTLRWWELVERHPNDNPKKKHSGFWKATEYGKDFSSGNIHVPEKVFTYAGDVVDVSPENIFIKNCFKTYFDYEKTMDEVVPGWVPWHQF